MSYTEVASHIFVPFHAQQRPMPFEKVFARLAETVIEIGSGQGEFLVQQALERPQDNFVGIEMDWGRLRKVCQRVSRLGRQEQESVVRNLRLFHIDAWVFFERICHPCSVHAAVCLFPCPWPKDRHEHHRLFSNGFLRLLNSRLQQGKELTVVTDHWPYAEWIREQLMEQDTGLDLVTERSRTRFETKFERKWRAAGQEEFCRMEFRKIRHLDISVKEDRSVKAYYHRDFDPERFEPADESGRCNIIFKDFLYDRQAGKGIVQAVVSEEHLTQHVFIGIVRTDKGWCVLKLGGQQVIPSEGIARAVEAVSEAVGQSGGGAAL